MTIKIKKVTRKGKVFYRFQMLGDNGKKLNDLYNRREDCIGAVLDLGDEFFKRRVKIIDVDGEEI